MSTLAVVATWDENPDAVEWARRMGAHLRYRCPDGMEIACAGGAALAFGRLVVSRKQGHQLQPLHREQAGTYLVGDLRIDNRADLARALGLSSDATGAEVVLAAYERWGDEVAAHLDGDFAFVIWDARRRRIVAARDPFGVRPLVYRQLADRLLLASDVEQILAVDPTSKKVDDHAVVDFLLYRWRFVERTYFEPIKAVPPAHTFLCDGRTTVVRRYLRLRPGGARFRDEEEAFREFRHVFSLAVSERLDSEHPVLLHLSGGLDSSAIVCTADVLKRRGHSVPSMRAVGAIHPGLACDESGVMRRFESHLAFPVEFWDGTKPDFRDLDEPALAGPGARVSMNDGTAGDLEIAYREGARVVLGGHGGEIFESPPTLLADLVREREFLAWAQSVAAVRRSERPALPRFARWVARCSAPETIRSVARFVRSAKAAPRWLSFQAAAWAAARGPDHPFSGHVRRYVDDAALRTVFGPRMARVIENVQRPAAEASIEKRFPFLDLSVVDFALRLESHLWGPLPYPYRFHARALADLLPVEFLTARKNVSFDSAVEHRNRERLRRHALHPSQSSARCLSRYCSATGDSAIRKARGVPSPPGLQEWNRAAVEAWLDRVVACRPSPSS